MSCEKLGKKLGCHKSTVTRLNAWIKNRQELKSRTQEAPDGFKRSGDTDGPDIESVGTGPQAEHLDIKELIENSDDLPDAKTIIEKLGLVDDDNEKAEQNAKQLVKETLHHFPELIENTPE